MAHKSHIFISLLTQFNYKTTKRMMHATVPLKYNSVNNNIRFIQGYKSKLSK